MDNPGIAFDHFHLISRDAPAAAQWYLDKRFGEIARYIRVNGARQVHVVPSRGKGII